MSISSATSPARGTLFLVVGPSGAGKDSVIDAARRAIAGRTDIVFARRTITRPAEAGGEAHRPVSAETFERLRVEGGFSLSWQAHGLHYGIPREVEDDLATGRSVVANVSRTVLDEARRRFPPVRVLHVTAPLPVLATRLAARGREDADDIAERLQRAGTAAPSGDDVTAIVNDGALEDAVARFVAAVTTPERPGR